MSDEIDTPHVPERQRPKGRRSPKDGEIGIRYGGRNFLITPGQRLVAQDGPWHLVAVEAWNREGWTNFKLYFNRKAKKNMYNVSVNKRSIYGKRDIDILDEYHPERKAWVLQMALDFIDGKLEKKPERGIKVRYRKGQGWKKVVAGKKGR